LHWVKNSLVNQQPISVVNDQQRTPTYVNDICNGLIAMIETQAEGDFHLAGKNILTPYQMAVILANTLDLDAALITPVTSETFVEPVKRAKKSGLKIDKAISELNYQPVSFEEGVRLSFL
jgi:dTDP-4-dehydrorhamnose reductase